MSAIIKISEILKPNAKLYFVGIGGIAMSAAACIAAQKDFEVTGSESKEVYNPAKKVLDDHKIQYVLGYNEQNITDSKADLFILSAGEGLDNPEVKYIIDKNLPRIGFAELLFELSRDVLRVVVTGTHGKTTTSSLMGHVLKNLDDSGFMAGGVLQNYGSNFYLGNGHYFVFEGDEYKNEFDDPTPKFHFYKPDVLVLTNLEYDHPDVFENFEALEAEFRELIDKMPEDGLIVYNADNAALTHLVHQSNVASVSFGIDNEADFTIENIQYGAYTQHQFSSKYENDLQNKSNTTKQKIGAGYTKFQVQNKFSKDNTARLLNLTEEYQIQLPGKINVYNALAVVATLRSLGFQPEQLMLELLSFTGVKRRFELVGIKNQITIIDDYAHHPTAVKETLDAAKLKFPDSRIWAVFEPHTFSRTKATLPEITQAFGSADMVLVSEIYPAREKAGTATITSEEVVKEIKNKESKFTLNNSLRKVSSKDEALNILKAELKPGDVVIVMAVGAFNRLAYDLKETL